MTMEQLSVFFAGSVLFTLSVIVIIAGIIAINNLMHRYWKPVTWFKYDYRPVYFDPDTGEQLTKHEEPTLTTLTTKAKK
jgi:hypothetical protein|tara:strand:- start:579 stop:815 length:237 start_codon:yes stop_codon:yes gene_type:complete